MTLKYHSRSSSVVPIESSYVSCYQWSSLTFAVSLTVYEIQAVSMPKTTFLSTQVVFDLEFEGLETKVGARKLESWGCHMVKKS